MLKRIVFSIQLLFVLAMSLCIGVFLAYFLSLFIDFALGLKLHDTAGLVMVLFLPPFVIFCLVKFFQNNKWE